MAEITSTQAARAYDALIDEASARLAARDYARCHELCIAAIRHDARRGDAYFLLSILTADHGNFAKAIEVIELAIQHGGEEPRFLAQKAKCLVVLNRHAEAAQTADRAEQLSPDDEFSLQTLAVIFSRIGEHARAVPLFEQACARNPVLADHRYNLGSSLQFSGKFEEAARAYEAAIARQPDHFKAYYGLTSLGDQSEEDERLALMQEHFAAGPDADGKLHLGHAIAKVLEDKGQYEDSLATLIEAKAAKRATLDYDFAQDEAIFAAARELADISVSADSVTGAGPIFITGMPRTGTTLVDRILSSHSGVMSMGELAHFGLFLKQASGTASPFVLDAETLARASQVDLRDVGDTYLAATKRLRGGTANFIDKMPLNIFYAPLLLAALPGARVICLQRGAMDTCLSNFRQLFSTSYSYYNYAYDLADTGRYFLAFERLVETWQGALPPSRFTTVRYEEMVANTESETRRLLDFCGLAFEPACLDFSANSAPVATASSVQVRKPIYSSSIDRWKRYGDALEPLAQVIRAAGRL